MLRRLLTLLAVVTSFVSLVEPAQAARFDTGVEASTSSERASACIGAMLAAPFRIERGPGETGTQPTRCPAALMTLAPAVYVQADRAHE